MPGEAGKKLPALPATGPHFSWEGAPDPWERRHISWERRQRSWERRHSSWDRRYSTGMRAPRSREITPAAWGLALRRRATPPSRRAATPASNAFTSTAYFAAASSLSCVLVSKSLASCRSRSWDSGFPNERLTMRPRFTAGRSAISVRPPDDVGVARDVEELARAVDEAGDERAIPGVHGDVGDRVLVAGEVAVLPRGAGRARRAGASPPSRSDRWRTRSSRAHTRRSGRSRRRGRGRCPSARRATRGTRSARGAPSAGTRRTSPRGRGGSRPTRRRASAGRCCDP